ncbi:MAG TPA: M20/M25/M40 family metallo-hydrolase [Bdellovibrionota bacterium]|nr:M20/M25/M40 family metallo-hydrolase [Bdellovibrionota bacterium]
MTGKITAAQIDERIAKHKDSILKEYKKIVESPSVSADPKHKGDIRKTAELASDYLKKAGADVTIIETPGNPVVFGHIENKSKAPTVAVYNHLDVQPVSPKGQDGWEREPFQFTEERGRFYSRGTTDDKGPAMAAFWAAKIAKEFEIPINVEFIWEFEEEIGSPHFAEFCTKAKERIKAQSVVVSDTIWITKGKPAIPTALRGLVALELRLDLNKKDVHSGLCGGVARNPLAEMCQIISSCIDAKTGDITIPGIRETWTPPSEREVADFLRSGFSVTTFKKDHELTTLRTENTAEVAQRIWAMPTFEVHGIAGGYQGPGIKTAIPHSATAKISLRLVPGQQFNKIIDLVRTHVKKINPDCEVLMPEKAYPAYAAPKGIPQIALVSDAMEFAFGAKPAFTREGGSIPAVATMEETFKVPVVFLGLSLPEDGYHCPNESFAWEQLAGGIKAFVKYFELLAASR